MFFSQSCSQKVSKTNTALAVDISRSIGNNDTQTLKQLLKKCKKASVPLPVEHEGSMPALHLAASKSHSKECLELLLKYKKRRPNLFGINDEWMGETALHHACRNGCEENVIMLLQNGCNPYKTTADSKTSPLMLAIRSGYTKVVLYLLNHYPHNVNQGDDCVPTPLLMALDLNDSTIILNLLNKGANALVTNGDGNLPLHLACRGGFKENRYSIVTLLILQSRISVNQQDSAGNTPIMIAIAKTGDLRFARYLHDFGAKTGICNDLGEMALHYAFQSHDAELLCYILEHTDLSCIEQCFLNIPNIFKAKRVIRSFTCYAIRSGDSKCLEILLNSNKLPRYILQTPSVDIESNTLKIYSPVADIFFSNRSKEKRWISYLHLLRNHDLIMLDEFFSKLKIEWPCEKLEFQHPYSVVFNYDQPFRKVQKYFWLLIENNVTTDYCLQCYHDNTKPFATFTDYYSYYKPAILVVAVDGIELLKLIMSNTDILEPDELLIQFNAVSDEEDVWLHQLGTFLYSKTWSEEENRQGSEDNTIKYLISLKPIYYRQSQLSDKISQRNPNWYPYSTVGEEFSKCTLKQLCRSTIRHHLRKYTLEENLRDFRGDIHELPLPTTLKDYLLFKG